jgi:hypothetical protein
VPEPVAVCDTAVPLRPHTNAVDKMAIAAGATMLDENLITVCSQIQDGKCHPSTCTILHIFNSRSLKAVAMSVPGTKRTW